jgi:hypothetical protein
MSLSQIWVVGRNQAINLTQTIEVGWQVMQLWDPHYASTFIFSTSDSYRTTGCYVSKCPNTSPGRLETFHVVTNKIIVGKPITKQSVESGEQGVEDVQIYRDPTTGDRWVRIDGEAIGFYPAAVFGDGPLARNADLIRFGGETTGDVPTAEMGSGHFAADGLGKAAFQSRLRYFDLNDRPVSASVIPLAPSKACYTIQLNGPADPETEHGTYLFFGGPGTRHFENPGQDLAQEACGAN